MQQTLKEKQKCWKNVKLLKGSKKIKITYKFIRNKMKRWKKLGAIQKQDGTLTKCDQEMAEVLNSEL